MGLFYSCFYHHGGGFARVDMNQGAGSSSTICFTMCWCISPDLDGYRAPENHSTQNLESGESGKERGGSIHGFHSEPMGARITRWMNVRNILAQLGGRFDPREIGLVAGG
jgi:hypothetical protein